MKIRATVQIQLKIHNTVPDAVCVQTYLILFTLTAWSTVFFSNQYILLICRYNCIMMSQ